MNSSDKKNIYHSLRKEYPVFVYEKFDLETGKEGLKARFHFNISDKFHFKPKISIPRKQFLHFQTDEAELNNLVFQMGMVELISYWKAACSPEVIIQASHLEPEQISWWKKLYFNGLGEFFFLNGIHASIADFMDIRARGNAIFSIFYFDKNEGYLVPIGGGKDSVVTLETLSRSEKKVIPFMVNPGKAGFSTVKNAGFSEEDILTVHRNIDPTLLEMNRQGFLNGHTPFSAVVAFISLLGSRLAGTNSIALSNESSANEATVIGTNINHQYSKSFEFERDFRDYTRKYISKGFNYFSFLRPLNELQIGKAFSKFPQHFHSFKSCNIGIKTDRWCAKCPKCLFTWIILSPFINQKKLSEIFGTDLLADAGLIEILEQLIGKSDVKPFECVGTIEEVNMALIVTINQIEKTGNPLSNLLQHYTTLPQYSANKNVVFNIGYQNQEHFLSGSLLALIGKSIA